MEPVKQMIIFLLFFKVEAAFSCLFDFLNIRNAALKFCHRHMYLKCVCMYYLL